MLPMVQNTSPCSVSSLAMNCSIETRALKVKTSAMPNRMTPEVATGPAGDAVQQQGQQGEDKGVGRDKPLAGNTGQANTEHNRQRGAKRRSRGDAEGKRLASGLLRMVCISAPASPSARPTIIAITA